MSYLENRSLRNVLFSYTTDSADLATHLDLGAGKYRAKTAAEEDDILEAVSRARVSGQVYSLVEKRTEVFAFCLDLDFKVVRVDIPKEQYMEYMAVVQAALYQVVPNESLLKCYISHTTVPSFRRQAAPAALAPVASPLTEYVEAHIQESSTKAQIAQLCKDAADDADSGSEPLERAQRSSSTSSSAPPSCGPVLSGSRHRQKQGIHLVWPDLLVNKRTALWLRAVIIHALSTRFPQYVPKLGKDGRTLAGAFTNTWEDIVDEVIYTANGLRMNGAQKTEACRTCAPKRGEERRARTKQKAEFERERQAYAAAVHEAQARPGGGKVSLQPPTKRSVFGSLCDACKTCTGKVPIPGFYTITHVIDARCKELLPELNEMLDDPRLEIKRTTIRRFAASEADVCDLAQLSVPESWEPEGLRDTDHGLHTGHPEIRRRVREKKQGALMENRPEGTPALASARFDTGTSVRLDPGNERHSVAIAAFSRLMSSAVITGKYGEALNYDNEPIFYPNVMQYTVIVSGAGQRCLCKAARTNDPEARHEKNRIRIHVYGRNRSRSQIKQTCFDGECNGSADVGTLPDWAYTGLFDPPPEDVPLGVKRSASSTALGPLDIRPTVSLLMNTASSTPCSTPRSVSPAAPEPPQPAPTRKRNVCCATAGAALSKGKKPKKETGTVAVGTVVVVDSGDLEL